MNQLDFLNFINGHGLLDLIQEDREALARHFSRGEPFRWSVFCDAKDHWWTGMTAPNTEGIVLFERVPCAGLKFHVLCPDGVRDVVRDLYNAMSLVLVKAPGQQRI